MTSYTCHAIVTTQSGKRKECGYKCRSLKAMAAHNRKKHPQRMKRRKKREQKTQIKHESKLIRDLLNVLKRYS